MALETVSLQY